MNLKSFFSLCLLLILAQQSFAQTPVWSQMPGSPSGTTRHDDIVFVNETTGWSARGRGGIFKTTDAGNTWTQVNFNSSAHFRCLGFISETHGFAGNLGPGSYDTGVTDTNVLYRTTDGGGSWSVVPGLSGMKGFCAMYVLDSQHIYGGGRVRGPAHFVKSEDGGTNWTVVDMGTNGLNVMGGIMDVYFKDPLNGFVVGMDTNAFFNSCGGNYHGRIAKTTDGGATWTAVADTGRACTYFWKMSWPTPDVGYTSLQQNGTASNLIFYKTIDGGNTWISNGIPYSEIGIPSFTLLQGIGFVSTNEGWVGGPSASSAFASTFLHTTNGGTSWTPAGYANSSSINRIRFYENFGVASGAKLHIFRVPPAEAPSIITQPQSQTVGLGVNATFTAGAAGTAPLNYRWRFNGTNLSGEINSSFTRTNVQTADAGNYSVVVTNSVNSVTSAVATLTVLLQNGLLFQDNFDGYGSPSVITNSGTTNGYKIFFGAVSGGEDFKAIFGFDYSGVTFPINVPPAPNSSGGTTKGLFLAVNKADATAAAAAVNLYPLGLSASNDFSLKFDLWLNWTNLGSSTEHALFGINHSGNVTNRVVQNTSDGLFFAVDGDGNASSTATTVRDYSVFRGGGNGAIPIFMTTNNTTFGPTPPLGPQFDNNNAGFVNLFPSKAIPGYPTTPAGTPGLGWVSGEVRQENNLITWLLNGTTIAQYTNTFDYTNGNVMIGYNDTFDSLGYTNVFVIFDNVRVEYLFPTPVTILSPHMVGNDFRFSFVTEPNASYTVQRTTDLTTPNWTTYTNVVGNGNATDVLVPLTNNVTSQYFRVRRP